MDEFRRWLLDIFVKEKLLGIKKGAAFTTKE
jgi:hypothetical protein